MEKFGGQGSRPGWHAPNPDWTAQLRLNRIRTRRLASTWPETRAAGPAGDPPPPLDLAAGPIDGVQIISDPLICVREFCGDQLCTVLHGYAKKQRASSEF